MPPKGGKAMPNMPKEKTKAQIEKEMQKEKEMKEKQKAVGEKKPALDMKAAAIKGPPPKAKVNVSSLSKKELQAKQREEKQKRDEEEQRQKDLEELRMLEQMEREANGEVEVKEKKKRDKYASRGMAVFGGDDGITEEEKNAQLVELMNALASKQKEEAEVKKKQREEEKQIIEEEKVKKQTEAWDMCEDDDDDIDGLFGDDDGEHKKQKQQKVKDDEEDETYKKRLNTNDMRSPIVCVLGHVDTGKTSILDYIRASTVQAREVGGITQQIGASFLSKEFIVEKTKNFPHQNDIKVPGMLIVDTPGHESFSNLRSRGSSLADIVVLVVDIMHGIEPQTLESIQLLKATGCPFVIALNKIDRLYEWKTVQDRDAKASFDVQSEATMNDIEHKFNKVIRQMGEQDYTVDFWWKVEDITETIAVIPTSARTGEGLPDLIALLIKYSQQLTAKKLTYQDEMQCTILEVRKTQGYGFTLDCILVNGMLKKGDRIVFAGQEGGIATTVRGLLTPKEAKEIREESAADYESHAELQAAVGFKLFAEGLELAVAGTPIFLVEENDDEEELKEIAMEEMKSNTLKVSNDIGVYVHSNSLGALEALVGYLRSENTQVQRDTVPVSAVAIGPITNKTLQEIKLQHERGHPEFAVILAFDVNIAPDLAEKAKEFKVTIINAKIIYHLYDQFQLHMESWHKAEKDRLKSKTVFPLIMKCIAVFNTHDPCICGFKVIGGTAQRGMPLALASGKPGGKFIGTLGGIQIEKKDQDEAKIGSEVAIRIDGGVLAKKGGDFDVGDLIYSRITRESIDIMKIHYRPELQEVGGVIKQIKEKLGIQ